MANTVDDTETLSSFFQKCRAEQLDDLRGGVIFEVTSIEQAKLAQRAGARAVVLTRLAGGVQHAVDDLYLISQTKRAILPIPLMLRVRVGHAMEVAKIERLRIVDFLDESELLGVVDTDRFVKKGEPAIPIICGCRNLAEALIRVNEGAAMLRIQGDLASSNDIAETVKIVKSLSSEIEGLRNLDKPELLAIAQRTGIPVDLLLETKKEGRLPVVHFAAGGILTAADAELMLQLGCDGVYVSSEIFNGEHAFLKAEGIVRAVDRVVKSMLGEKDL